MGVPVQTASMQIGSIEDTVSVTGDLAALDSAILSAKILGRVVYVSAREGEIVKKGQIIIQVDKTDANAMLRQAEDGLRSAHARLS